MQFGKDRESLLTFIREHLVKRDNLVFSLEAEIERLTESLDVAYLKGFEDGKDSYKTQLANADKVIAEVRDLFVLIRAILKEGVGSQYKRLFLQKAYSETYAGEIVLTTYDESKGSAARKGQKLDLWELADYLRILKENHDKLCDCEKGDCKGEAIAYCRLRIAENLFKKQESNPATPRIKKGDVYGNTHQSLSTMYPQLYKLEVLDVKDRKFKYRSYENNELRIKESDWCSIELFLSDIAFGGLKLNKENCPDCKGSE